MDDTQLLADLRRRVNGGERLKFLFFWGDQPHPGGITASCLSQWYLSPFAVDEQRYPTAEHFMMAEKAALFGDGEMRSRILQAPHPGAAKALGREVRGFDEARWLQERFAIVVRGNEAKFGQDAALRRYLMETGTRILVEASPVDPVWGIGLAADDARAGDPNRWRGLNLLGFALMEVRARLGRA